MAGIALGAAAAAAPAIQSMIGSALVNFGAAELPAALQTLSAFGVDDVLHKGLDCLKSQVEEGLRKDVAWDDIKGVLGNVLKLNASTGDPATKEWLKSAALEKIEKLSGAAAAHLGPEAQKLVNAFTDATVAVTNQVDELRLLQRLQLDAGYRYQIHSDLGERNDRLSKWLAIPMAIISTIVSLLTAPTAFNETPKETKFIFAVLSTLLSILVSIFSILINNIEPGQKAGKHLAVATTYHQIRQSLTAILLLHSTSGQPLAEYILEYEKRMSEAEKMCPLKWEDPDSTTWMQIFHCLLPFSSSIKDAYISYNRSASETADKYRSRTSAASRQRGASKSAHPDEDEHAHAV